MVVDGTTYEAGAVVLATGSVALPIPGVEFGDRVVDTWGAWSLPELPKSIAVVGAGPRAPRSPPPTSATGPR